METWKDLIGKKVKVIFEDGVRHPSKKEGEVVGYTRTHLIILTDFSTEGILLSKIIRWEVMK